MKTRSSQLFQALFSSDIPRILVASDSPHYTILDYNEAYDRATFLQGMHVRGLSLWGAFLADNVSGDVLNLLVQAMNQAALQQVVVNIPPFQYELPTLPKDLIDKNWWQFEILPINGDDGNVDSILVTIFNITEQQLNRRLINKAGLREDNLNSELAASYEALSATNEELVSTLEDLKKSREQLSASNLKLEERVSSRTMELENKNDELKFLADSIPSIVWTATPTGKIDYINERWHQVNLPGKAQPLGDAWVANLHPDDVKRAQDTWAHSIRTGKPYEVEFRVLNPKGEYCWYLARALPMRNKHNEIVKWYGNNTDIHHQKELQQQKDDFITIASHELKTPITTLKGALQLLDRVKEKPDSGMMKKLILQSRKAVDKIGNLVDNLLNVRRLQEGQVALDKTNFILSELVNAVANPYSLTTKQRILIRGDKELRVNADEHRIDQVITNFLNNAVKYAARSEEIIIDIQHAGGFAKVSVIDQGDGIPTSKASNLFKRYYRGDYSGQQYSGLGLGLYISAEIIAKHSGQIGVESAEGKGATFWFTLPLGYI